MTWMRFLRRAIAVHRGRFVFATVSVVLGVTAFVGISIGTGTMSQALRLQNRQVASGPARGVYLTPIGVWNARGSSTAAKRIGQLEDVEDVEMGLGFSTPIAGDEQLYVYGQSLTSSTPTQGRNPAAAADEVLLNESVAGRLGVSLEQPFPVTVPDGTQVMARVVGFMRDGNLSTSLATVQRWAKTDDVEGVYVVTRRGVDANAWAERHVRDTGVFQRAANELYSTDAITFFRAVENSVTPIASGALVLGAFLIYLTVSRTVQDRQRDLAVLRAVGGSRRRVLGLILSEALAAGVIGTIIGLLLGVLVARGVANLMSGVFNVSINLVPKLNAPASVLVKALTLGMLAPVVASLVPALRAGRQDPAPLLRGAGDEYRPGTRVATLGVFVFAIGLLATVGVSARVKPLGFAVCLVGLVMSGPAMSAILGRGLVAIAKRTSSMGEVAAQRISRRPGRSARTSALLATTLAVVVILLVIAASGRAAYVHTVDADLAEDLTGYSRSGTTISAALVDDVRRTPGVEAVATGAVGSTRSLDKGGRDEFLTVVDPVYFDVADFAWTQSSSKRVAREALQHSGRVLMATAISQRLHKHVGDTVTLQTQSGPRRFRVAATFAGLPTGNTHAVVVSLEDARRWFGYHGATRLWIRTAPGAAPAVEASLRAAHPDLGLDAKAIARANYVKGFDGAWSLVALTGVIASGIGLMGLVNTMVMEVFDRRFEIGLMRAVGAHRRDIRRMVTLEALGFGVIAGVVGLAAGSAIARAGVTGVGVETELPQSFRYSPIAVPLVIGLALVAGVIAGRLPARRAARVDPAVVLRSL
ncbi:MAG TPA: FtsX-like permease family protein [Acidimicrobiales bacterium]|nr:FtsX-like permease family protein [Acidimicrobiales bacterium]